MIAGGTDLLGALKDAIHDDPPELVIGLKPVTALRYVKATPAGVRIGALTTLSRDRQTPGDPPDLSAPRRSRGQRGLAADSQRRDDRRQPLPGTALLVLPQPRQHLRLPAQGRRWCDALFAENRYHSIFGGMCVSAAPCVAGCPIHNDIPAYMAKTPGRQAGRSGGDPAAHQSAAGHHGPGVCALLRGGMQPVRLRRAGVDPRRRALPGRLCAGTCRRASTRRPQSNRGRPWRSSARARPG